MLKSFLKVSLIWVFSLTLAHADLTIEIDQSDENALPIAMVPLAWQGAASTAPVDLASVMAANFHRTGKFRPIDEADMPQLPHSLEEVRYDQWRNLDVDTLITGSIQEDSPGFYTIDLYLIDVLRRQQVIAKRWANIPQKWLRKVAHQMSDLAYKELTGIRGAFSTQIAYVTLEKVDGERRYALEVADADGFGAQKILKSSFPIMSPSWSPDGKQLAYVSFENGRSEVFAQSLDGKYRELLASFKGINGAPAWSPDGKQMAITLSKDGSADIYIMDLKTKNLRRLTTNWAIETEAVWSSNGRSLFYNSDRRGQPQIFQVFLDTGEERRVSFEGNYNANPEISPDGRYLAMVHGSGGFHIGVLDLYTNDFSIITKTFLDESPSFSPNGEMILYAMNRGGVGRLASVSVDGRITQIISSTSGQVREPAWGPFKD
ncbi:Tol-Pal system beta propeller repeat protein TolB [Thiosulfativibrio zosterae]|uniref:Tol-Pal system protein TolB n=1 Tax=Thiosulfativibrio zosterae TaxID=2675053 RepID=A0A6F8PNP9_9GAMM|nr:Tol-Pal system beta propeller repeat protein TolB [Thiosulfativibrio zosterae]BBP43742.1 protein TolB [Thiosulfativibrio zosterae]